MRKLPSGRFQARYSGPDGVDRPAPQTFPTKTDAELWLIDKEAEIRRGDWLDPDAGAVLFSEYAPTWIVERPNLRPATVGLYGDLYRLHLKPGLGHLGLVEITPGRVRKWRTARLDDGIGAVTVAKAYRLLKAIMNTAADDGLIRKNPCRIKGGGVEQSPERPILSVEQVFALVDAIGPRYKALVLLATFASMRWGELLGLRRCDIDLEAQTIRIERAVQEIGGELVVSTPKTRAGIRTVTIPKLIVPDLRWHLRVFAEPGPDGRVIVGARGATPRRSNFRKVWRDATGKVGLTGVHLHDLRHTGATLAASTGATLRELMDRLGHTSARAAMVYQHSTTDRDRAIADALDTLAREARKPGGEDDDPPAVNARTGT